MKRFLLFFFLVIVIWTFCSDYNPFKNPTNVNIVVLEQKTTLKINTINHFSIFTTETLTVAATVKEKVDSFTVVAEGNRYWQRKSFIAPISSGEIMFLFSYSDTGQRKVTLNTYRDNGDVIPLEFSLVITSPLLQEALIVESGRICSLSTPPVGDNDVTYFWHFQKDNSRPFILSYPDALYPVQINDVLIGNTGYLWVEDDSGNISPEVTFSYSFVDTTGPVILCVNEGIKGDTVVTGASSFIFKIECYDGLGIGSALVNDGLFTDSTVNIKSTAYYKTFIAMDTLTSYFPAIVKSWDNGNNESIDTLYIRYDINGPKEVIFIRYPPQNPYTTNQDSYTIFATIFNPVSDSIVVKIEHVETGTSLFLDTLIGNAEKDVTYTAALQAQSNTIVIYVLDKDSLTNILAKDTVSIIYTTGIIEDKTPPYIHSVKVNGKEGKSHFIAGSNSYLELEASDEHMDSAFINGELKQEVAKYVWKDTMVLNGAQQFFIIHLVDSSNNTTDDTVRVQRNYLPVIDPLVSWPRTLVIGQPWHTIFMVNDEDGDSVDITHEAGINSSLPDSGAVTFTQLTMRRWMVQWKGSSSISNQSVNQLFNTQVVLSDGKQNTVYPWNFSIKDSSQTTSYIFKMILPKGTDTTDNGDLDLSMDFKQVTVNCLLIAEAKQFMESDTIVLKQPDQTLKFAADANDTNEFNITFNPKEKEDNEIMIISVIDSLGTEVAIDTIEIIYFHYFPDEIDSLGWLLQADTGVKEEDGRVYEWHSTFGNYRKLARNPYTTDLYNMETTPRYFEDGTLEFPILRFSPEDHSNLYTENSWIVGPFTFFFVVKPAQGGDAQNDSANILISTGTSQYIGLGVFHGKMGIVGQVTGQVEDTVITCNMKVTKGQWHILYYSSEQGMGDSNVFDLQMRVDGSTGSNNSIILPDSISIAGGAQYLILGGGSKHYAAKNWYGDMAEVIKYAQFLNDEECVKVERYLACKYKIKLHR